MTTPTTTQCESATVLDDNEHQTQLASSTETKRSWRQQLYRAWRMFWRCCKLAVTLAPIAAFSPILWFSNIQQLRPNDMDAQDVVLLMHNDELESNHNNPWLEWYLKLCLKCVESSGAAVIKLLQWAGTRPDLFGYEFGAVFSQLQDHTTPHDWQHTAAALERAYGPQWHDRIQLDPTPVGSGCIGQVYRGTAVIGGGQGQQKQEEQRRQPVAVKVLHPSVHEDIDADLDWMRLFVHVLDRLPTRLSWLNLPGAVEEFAKLLTLQLDLRNEAHHLQQFRHNFRNDAEIVFPQPLMDDFSPTADILVETYHEGTPVLQYAREHQHDRKRLSELCFKAIRCVCKMIFLDNFIHGDLHPGNVFVAPDGKSFVLLDVGIVAEYSQHDHQVIVDILSSFIRRQGRKAGRCMIADSNHRRGQPAVDEELFLNKIDALTWRAADKDHHLMEHLGTYITQICNAAADHHIMMNQSFVSAALAIKVQEGIALALDPQLEMWKVATPIIIESERRRKGLLQSAAQHVMGGYNGGDSNNNSNSNSNSNQNNKSNKWVGSNLMSKEKV